LEEILEDYLGPLYKLEARITSKDHKNVKSTLRIKLLNINRSYHRVVKCAIFVHVTTAVKG
jgi:hypothetical protein